MRFALWALLVFTPLSALACAAQNSETDRQVRELDARVKQLAIKSDRMEDRLQALEVVQRSRIGSANAVPNANSVRPDLPTVRLDPNRAGAESRPEVERTSEAGSEESRRLTIVGEGSRVETREAGDANSSRATSPATKSNSRAPKHIQGNVPATSNGGAPQ